MYDLIYTFLEDYIFTGSKDFLFHGYSFRTGAIVTTPIVSGDFNQFLCTMGATLGVIGLVLCMLYLCRYIFRLFGGLFASRG